MSQQHYFYALELPMETKEKIGAVCREMQEKWPFNRWVHPQDYHITFAFLGNADERMLSDSIRKLEAGIDVKSFFLKIAHLDVFGKHDSPRIFWAGVNEQPFLGDAREVVFQACKAVGFKLETRPFNPHITLARKWNGDSPFEKEMLDQANPFKLEEISFQAENIVLYKTHLGKEPKYEVVLKFSLL